MKTQLLKHVLDQVAWIEMTVYFLMLANDGSSILRTEAPSLAVPPPLCVALAEPPLFKWAKLRSGGECKSCLVWVCELQRDFNDIHRG